MPTPQMPSAPAKVLPPCMAVPLFGTIPEVVGEMTRRWRKLQRAHDWRAVFAKSYLRTTEQILAASQGAGTFENPGGDGSGDDGR